MALIREREAANAQIRQAITEKVAEQAALRHESGEIKQEAMRLKAELVRPAHRVGAGEGGSGIALWP